MALQITQGKPELHRVATGWRRPFPRLFVRRECWGLTRAAKLGILAVFLCSLMVVTWFIHPFLAITAPVNTEYLVVEAWIPRYALQESVVLYQKGGYRKAFTSGCPRTDDLGSSSKTSSAEAAAIQMERFGMSTNAVTAVSCWVERKDRTFNSALTLKEWFQQNGMPVSAIDVVTLGPHARRSRLLYEKAFGNKVKVGVISIEDRSYDPAHWWRCSEGVREVVGEGIAYIYARVFFHPSEKNLNNGNTNDTNRPFSTAATVDATSHQSVVAKLP
jgi:hypothetical protein